MRFLACLLLLFGTSAMALAAGPVVLKARRMFDGKSDRITTPGLVVVVAGTLQGIGADAAVPAGAGVIDFGDSTLRPGVMDAHTHLSQEASDDWKQDMLDGLRKTIPERALDATEYS